MEQLGDIGECEAIRRITALLGDHADLRVGAGDDCAVARLEGTGYDQVFTTDPVIEGVHFPPGEDPFRIGNKAAGRVLSDLAAMGAQPQWLLVNIAAPASLEMRRIEAVYQGMNACCSRFGATIIGGDLAESQCLELHVFGTGLLPHNTALLRSGASTGDAIFVTGSLGGSRAGRHLDFIPRVKEGIFLRESGAVTAMLDISDGLATDLRHLLERSGVGAELDAGCIPAYGSLEEALFDGEDFELLFTVAPDKVPGLLNQWREAFHDQPIRIGYIAGDTGLLNVRFPDGSTRLIQGKAFEHFSR